KERRKRSRVTPEQLKELEILFAADRSPTAARRKEISERLGMDERQTQIWFQNRRAKARHLHTKVPRSMRHTVLASRDVVFDDAMMKLVHEQEPVMFIPCTDLFIGTWHRVVVDPAAHELLAFVSDARTSL
ncbi:homeobox-domain-containing protein, partial [Fistulina hepatica ATCC 64428]